MVQACDWTNEDNEKYFAKIWTGTIVGIVIALPPMVLVSLPVCCGVMKEKNLKPMAIASGIFSGLCILIPLFTGLIIASTFMDDLCDRCAKPCAEYSYNSGESTYYNSYEECYDAYCPQADKDRAQAIVSIYGSILAYIY